MATTQPSRQDSTSASRDTARISASPPMTAAADSSAANQYTMTQGSIMTPENIRPMRYTPSRREARMARMGMGRDSSRSLSLAWYRPAKVLNTLPNTPMNRPKTVNRVKYSQPRPLWYIAPQMLRESRVNIPPSRPTISRTYITIRPTVAALDRILFFFAS